MSSKPAERFAPESEGPGESRSDSELTGDEVYLFQMLDPDRVPDTIMREPPEISQKAGQAAVKSLIEKGFARRVSDAKGIVLTREGVALFKLLRCGR